MRLIPRILRSNSHRSRLYPGGIVFLTKNKRDRGPLARLIALDEKAFTAVARRHSPLGDLVLPKLSRAANNSAIWIVVAALLAAFGGRRGKRAAGRGIGSILVTSLTVNQGIKRIVRRPRPPLRNVPAVRRLKSAPLTTSFPSGHAASAAAFTTAVLMEWRATGRLTMPVAALVAYSRVYVGVHYPGDVTAGAGIGAAIALLSRLQFPVVPADRRSGPATGPVTIATGLKGEGLHVLANPDSGSPLGFDHSGPLSIGLPRAEIHHSIEGEELPDALKRITVEAEVLGASGGDGTIGAAAVVAAEADLPLMVLPGGTLNHLARDLRIDSVDDSITAYKEGQAVRIDLASAGGMSFINTATFGAYPEMIELRERLQNRIGRWPAHVASVLWTVFRADPLEVELNGESRTVWMVFIGNCCHEPEGFAPAWRPRLDDGELDVRILHGERPLARARLVLSILAGRLAGSAAYERHLVERLEVDSGEESLPVTRDGDHVEIEGTFSVTKRRRCLTVFAPHG